MEIRLLQRTKFFVNDTKSNRRFSDELSKFVEKNEDARLNAEILGLMVNEPHISPDELKKLNMPVLVIAGTHDMIKRSHTELIAHSITGACLKYIKGDHFIAMVNPEDFNRAVDEFLKEQ